MRESRNGETKQGKGMRDGKDERKTGQEKEGTERTRNEGKKE